MINTIQVRGLVRLRDLERELRVIVPGACEMRDLPTVLYVPVLFPCMDSERLSVSIDVQRGSYLVSLSHKGACCFVLLHSCTSYHITYI